jgi:hypothetical protein
VLELNILAASWAFLLLDADIYRTILKAITARIDKNINIASIPHKNFEGGLGALLNSFLPS